nr:MAG TPA: hypothetical protein [Caudoviricetes sp.]
MNSLIKQNYNLNKNKLNKLIRLKCIKLILNVHLEKLLLKNKNAELK